MLIYIYEYGISEVPADLKILRDTRLTMVPQKVKTALRGH
jgi:hypothetical protein